MTEYIWSYCVVCNNYKRIEVNNKIFKKIEKLNLVHGENKRFIICKKCLKKMKEGEKNE